MKRIAILALPLGLALAVSAYAAGETVAINPLPEGSVSAEQGLMHWSRIYDVTSSPRCSNCHVGEDNLPMWSGPSYGKTRPHGMNINAGESRIGAETILCSTCHIGANGKKAHGAPGVATEWQLAPVEFAWFGKPSVDVCNRLRDPEQNGGRSFIEIAEHLDHDIILHWAWDPGKGREPAPYSLQEHVNDILAWGAAGMPCEND